MKIKGEEYLRLHKLMTNVSTTSVWEMLSEDKDVLEILKDVPDEFYKKIKMYVQELRYNHYQFGERAGKIYQYFRYGKYGDRETEPTKKEFALHLQECVHNYGLMGVMSPIVLLTSRNPSSYHDD